MSGPTNRMAWLRSRWAQSRRKSHTHTHGASRHPTLVALASLAHPTTPCKAPSRCYLPGPPFVSAKVLAGRNWRPSGRSRAARSRRNGPQMPSGASAASDVRVQPILHFLGQRPFVGCLIADSYHNAIATGTSRMRRSSTGAPLARPQPRSCSGHYLGHCPSRAPCSKRVRSPVVSVPAKRGKGRPGGLRSSLPAHQVHPQS